MKSFDLIDAVHVVEGLELGEGGVSGVKDTYEPYHSRW